MLNSLPFDPKKLKDLGNFANHVRVKNILPCIKGRRFYIYLGLQWILEIEMLNMLNALLLIATDSSGSHTNNWELGVPDPDHIIAVIGCDFKQKKCVCKKTKNKDINNENNNK